jgi:hypothetical protein
MIIVRLPEVGVRCIDALSGDNSTGYGMAQQPGLKDEKKEPLHD